MNKDTVSGRKVSLQTGVQVIVLKKDLKLVEKAENKLHKKWISNKLMLLILHLIWVHIPGANVTIFLQQTTEVKKNKLKRHLIEAIFIHKGNC